MITDNAVIEENTPVNKNIYRLLLKTPMAKDVKPGQFVQVALDGFFLRRPFSVCRVEDGDHLSIIYKVVGEGTASLALLKKGPLNLFGPLGHPFPVADRDVLCLGGGLGAAALFEAAVQYRKNNRQVVVANGFATKDQVILEEEFKAAGCEVYTATIDGSCGIRGTVIDAVKCLGLDTSFVLACGPVKMLRSVRETCAGGYLSLEERMACGLGACKGCVVKGTDGSLLSVCKDGPVFAMERVVL